MKNNRVRLRNITLLQSFGIVLVVLGHSFPQENIPGIASWINSFIYSFHMPLFMALSGYLFIYSGGVKNKYISFINVKFKRLIIPYIVLSSIAFIPKVILSKYAMRPIELNLNNFIRNLFIPEENVIIFFWFLPTLFLIFLISPVFLRALTNKYYVLALTLTLALANVLNPFVNIKHFGLNYVVFYLIYFWLGCMTAKYYENIKFYINKNYVLVIVLLIIVLAAFYNYNSSVIKLILAVVGIVMSFSFVNLLDKNNVNLINYIDGYSYQIYLLSWFFQTFFMILFSNAFDFNYWITPLFMFSGGLILPVFIAKTVNKYFSKFNFLLGMRNQ
ncbi:acyltransferase family protein [Sporosarcina sp. CAU 1771]